MKKILTALTIAGLAYFSASAQSTQTQVCKVTTNKKTASCYKTHYAENFKVCKNDYGYFICGEIPGYYNSTYPDLQVVAETRTEVAQYENTSWTSTHTVVDVTVPQSQSYLNTNAGPY